MTTSLFAFLTLGFAVMTLHAERNMFAKTDTQGAEANSDYQTVTK
jgi:hypothetical protein